MALNGKCGFACKAIHAGALTASLLYASVVCSAPALAATAQVNGQAALVGEFISNMPPKSELIEGLRFPFGLTIEGRASSNLGLFLDLRFNSNQALKPATALGNARETENSAQLLGSEVVHPFGNANAYAGRREGLFVDQAYVVYEASDAGYFRAGRMPRNWGLGLWLSDDWKPEGGAVSTTDAVSYMVDFSRGLSVTGYWEKFSEGRLGARSDDADALTGEILVADELTDVGSSGMSRRLGLAFSKYDHKSSSTEIKILDIFGSFLIGRVGIEGEVNWPTGKTKSLAFSDAGGSKTQCPEASNPGKLFIGCESQTVDGLNLLVRTKFQLSGGVSSADGSAKLSQTEAARRRRATEQVAESQIVTLTGGFSKGDSDAYDNATTQDDKITGIAMHPNVRPSLLMFNPLSENVAGMPGASVRNVVFVKAEYSYESPSFGMLTPAVIFARLDALNKKADVTEKKVGLVNNLGFEVNINYSYRTLDGLRLSLDGGLWVPGGAWETSGVKPETVYGARATAATYF